VTTQRCQRAVTIVCHGDFGTFIKAPSHLALKAWVILYDEKASVHCVSLHRLFEK